MFKQTTFAYFFDILGLLAGLLIVYQLDIFTRTPWALALYPTLITTRIISGLLSGRLSTALHLGTIHTRFMNNTKSFYQLIESVIVLTLITSLAVSAISLWSVTFFGV
jgi:cation transporter-like permease